MAKMNKGVRGVLARTEVLYRRLMRLVEEIGKSGKSSAI